MTQEPQAPSQSIEHLQQVLERLARPIEFASRNKGTSLPSIKNLGSFISNQVIQALGEMVYPPQVEAELLALRELFVDEAGLPLETRQHRLVMARDILARLNTEFPKPMGLSHSETGTLAQHKPKSGIPLDEETRLTQERVEGMALGNPEDFPHSSEGRRAPKGGRARVSDAAGSGSGDMKLWELSIRYAKGVGPKRAALFSKLSVKTIEDAFWYLPWRYEDRSAILPLHALGPGTKATVLGTIHRSTLRRTRRRRMTILTVLIRDDSATLEAVFFNQPYLEKILTTGTRVILSGPVSPGPGGSPVLQMKSPQYEVVGQDEDLLLHGGRIVSIYHETRGLTSRHLRWILHSLLDEYLPALEEIIPDAIRTKHQLPLLSEAVRQVHFPSQGTNIEALNSWKTSAHRRLAFEESFLLQLALAIRQQLNKGEVPGISFQEATPLITRLRGQLPFHLTQAQEQVIEEIRQDMASPRPMNRLIQGDVGSGKTVVALHAMVTACGSGYQTAFMAPTEILAEQHFLTLRTLLDALGIQAVVVKGGTSSRERTKALERIKSGEVQIVIGTHALIEEDVQFAKLGLVVVDEQHKFGVLQRATLRSKGLHPDVLVMTATPIPRTLAMTVYGDLDVSVIRELPPGRKPIRTRVFRRSERGRAYQVLRDYVQKGGQAYVVYPLVEESEKVDLEAAMQAAERLQTEEFPSMRVGLLHGRMKSEEKSQAMASFKNGEIQILVATTVIEVGLDVPNATVMLIEHADRFGLAQLHQLRGRVGRGAQQSLCLLVSPSGRGRTGSPFGSGTEGGSTGPGQTPLPLTLATGPIPSSGSGPVGIPQSAQQRLQAMVNCSDGFKIAEEDLRIRGPGEFLGVRQWGVPEFRVVDLARDATLLEQARQEAFAVVARDPHLSLPEHHALKAAMLRRWQTKFDLGSVG